MGLFVMSRSGVSPAIWVQNVVAGVVGLAAAGMALKRGGLWARMNARRWTIPIGVVALLLTLLAPGLSGVHRWLPLGPVNVHLAAVLLPAMLVVFTAVPFRPSAILALSLAAIFLAQPDLAQGVAFILGWSVIGLYQHGRKAAPVIVGLLAIGAATTLRTDPLAPVDYVEEIIDLAFDQGLATGAASVLSLLLIPLAFLRHPDRVAGAGLAAYTAATLVAGWLGNFPVPVLGFGMSPILGYYGGVAMLHLFASNGRDVNADRGPAVVRQPRSA